MAMRGNQECNSLQGTKALVTKNQVSMLSIVHFLLLGLQEGGGQNILCLVSNGHKHHHGKEHITSNNLYFAQTLTFPCTKIKNGSRASCA